MADDADYIRHGFVAERRSLLVVSFILFFYQQAGLRIDEINVFGNKVSLDSPWWTAFSLWVLWGYFLVRFYQYFRIIPDKWFWNAYEQQMKKLIEASSFKHFKKEFKPSGEGERLWIRFQFCTFRDDFRKNAA
jgi:hypothetical protein